jgi:hypothetical protein
VQRKGYLTIQEHDRVRKIEVDTLTCGHCNRIILLHDMAGALIQECAGFCRVCMTTICLDCNGVLLVRGCTPFEKRVENSERRQMAIQGMLR